MLVLLFLCSLLVNPAFGQQYFTEDELRTAAKNFLNKVWEFGRKEGQPSPSQEMIRNFIEDDVLGETPQEVRHKELYMLRRDKVVEFAVWLTQIATKAKPYALKPFVGLRLATKAETPLYQDTIIWKITVEGDEGVANFTWAIYFSDAGRADVNEVGHRTLKIVSISRLPNQLAPLLAGPFLA